MYHIAIDADKTVIGLQLSVRSTALLDGLHIHTRLTVIHVHDSRIDLYDRNFQNSAVSTIDSAGSGIAALVYQRDGNFLGRIDRNGESQALLILPGAFGVDNADRFSLRIEQSAAGVPGADRRIRLEDIQRDCAVIDAQAIGIGTVFYGN